jgi:hypothetical protein
MSDAVLTSEAFAEGRVVRRPVGEGAGYWAGAPGAWYDVRDRAWYLTYRIRRPRGVAPDRGGEARIARSADLQHWDDVWSVTKDRYGSASIERSTIRRGSDGQWRYFTSYVDPADGRWCLAMLTAPRIDQLDAERRQSIFKAGALGLEGVKDPWIIEIDSVFQMFLSVAVGTPKTTESAHATLDIYNTGECLSATGLATSRDLDTWEWQGVVLMPGGAGWDGYCRRINSIVLADGGYLAFYDGSASSAENYEEKTGIAVSSDLKTWRVATPEGPLWVSPHASRSLRYLDAQPHGADVVLFYELARPDAAHELRCLTCRPSQLPRGAR